MTRSNSHHEELYRRLYVVRTDLTIAGGHARRRRVGRHINAAVRDHAAAQSVRRDLTLKASPGTRQQCGVVTMLGLRGRGRVVLPAAGKVTPHE